MEFPSFIDVEFSTPDFGGFPTSVTWSLPNGQIKSVLLIPDDDWDPWENTDGDVDLQFLFDQGVSGPDLIREINSDLDGKTVFVDGLDEDERLLELLFETYNDEFAFEIASITQLYKSATFEELLAQRNDIAYQQGFDLDTTEDKVRALIFLYKERMD